MPIPVSRLARRHREFVALLGLSQRLFGALTLCHISHCASPAHDRPMRIALCHASKLYPTSLAESDEADLDVVARRVASKMFSKCSCQERAVLGVERQPFDKVISARE